MAALVIIPSNENIVSGSVDKTIKVWSSKTFQLIATLTGHTDWVNTLAIIPSNENIVSGSNDETIRVWNSKTFQLIATLTGHVNLLFALAILPSNETIVSGSKDKTIKLWQYIDDDENNNDGDKIFDLTFLSSLHLATCSMNGIIRIWNIYTCKSIDEYSEKVGKQLSLDYFQETGELAFSEARSIKILNSVLLYSNFSNIN